MQAWVGFTLWINLPKFYPAALKAFAVSVPLLAKLPAVTIFFFPSLKRGIITICLDGMRG